MGNKKAATPKGDQTKAIAWNCRGDDQNQNGPRPFPTTLTESVQYPLHSVDDDITSVRVWQVRELSQIKIGIALPGALEFYSV
jgi:hypothetical protein